MSYLSGCHWEAKTLSSTSNEPRLMLTDKTTDKKTGRRHKQNTDERRREMLKMLGNGFSKAEIVKHLSADFGCSEEQIYYDLANLPRLKVKLVSGSPECVLARYVLILEQQLRNAIYLELRTKSEAINLGCQKRVTETVLALCEIQGLSGVKDFGSVQKMIVEIVDSIKFREGGGKVLDVETA